MASLIDFMRAKFYAGDAIFQQGSTQYRLILEQQV